MYSAMSCDYTGPSSVAASRSAEPAPSSSEGRQCAPASCQLAPSSSKRSRRWRVWDSGTSACHPAIVGHFESQEKLARRRCQKTMPRFSSLDPHERSFALNGSRALETSSFLTQLQPDSGLLAVNAHRDVTVFNRDILY